MSRTPHDPGAKSRPPASKARKSGGVRLAEPQAVGESGPVNAVIVDGLGDPLLLLSQALERAGLWHHLAQVAAAAQVEPVDLRIAIKPELGAFARNSPTATAPILVELLFDLLHDAGFANVVVASARDSSALWAENRDVLVLADLLGYRFATPKGRPYDIVDLGEDLVPDSFPEGTLLHGSGLARAWLEAQYRIVFAKNRTDEQTGYALCLDSLLGVLPLEDKDYYYHHRFDAGEVAAELLRTTPVQFAIIDAVVSAHGSAGSRAPTSIATGTLIASRHILLADYAGAAKMGLDPYASLISAQALRTIGLPQKFRIEGNLAPYPGWKNVHPLLADSIRQREAWVGASRMLKPWLQSVDGELFPFKSPINQRLNDVLASYFAKPDAEPGAFWTLVAINYYLAGIHRSVEAYRTLFSKDGLRRREVSLGLDLAKLSLPDYERIADELLPIADLVGSLTPDATGLRWRYLQEAVAFQFERVIPVPFDEFVTKVEISRTIQYMNDYIGGNAVPASRDESHRVTHQAERNLYLPQPNYLVLYQGDVIDVTKLEYATYSANCQRMFWKTIKSENGSARFDDGIVTFTRENGSTRVTICGRQLFNLPLFWQAVNLDLTPELKNALVTDAYSTFFRRTMANLEAVAEGREIRIGRPWHDPAVAPGTETLPTEQLTQTFVNLKDKVGDNWLRDITGLLHLKRPETTPIAVDADGFRHFSAQAPGGSRATARFADAISSPALKAVAGELFQLWEDFGEALRKDIRAGLGKGISIQP
jgi:uncharacterized protein (DUF362 family)